MLKEESGLAHNPMLPHSSMSFGWLKTKRAFVSLLLGCCGCACAAFFASIGLSAGDFFFWDTRIHNLFLEHGCNSAYDAHDLLTTVEKKRDAEGW